MASPNPQPSPQPANTSDAAAAPEPVARMSEESVVAELKSLPEWSDTGGSIQRTFQFKSFVESMRFVNRVADQAELDQHHPDILVRWNKVTLTLSTHDAGGISAKDFALARKADEFGKSIGAIVRQAPAKPGAGAKRAKK
jgi:4a-hydroxytetrahydrobiopterin dehydratase